MWASATNLNTMIAYAKGIIVNDRYRLETTIYGPPRAVDCDVNLLHVWASATNLNTMIAYAHCI